MKDTLKNLCFEGWEMIKRNKGGAGVRKTFYDRFVYTSILSLSLFY